VAQRKAFLLRLDPVVYDAMQRWAADELRSLNAQIEFVVRRALDQQGRLRANRATRAAREDPSRGGGT